MLTWSPLGDEMEIIMNNLKFGVAYHGNRMLSHALEDLKTIAKADMDIVVHMFSHNDLERHDTVMGDMFKATEALGMEVWVDNWGIGGAPGEKCHFLAYHPEAHTYYGDGIMHPYQICLNAPSYREFVKNWVDKVAALGGKTVFWDEPMIPDVAVPGTSDYYSACTCPTCRKMFEDRFNKKMPAISDADVAEFRRETIVDFHEFISNYSHALGLKNVICFMPYQLSGLKSEAPDRQNMAIDIDRICAMPHINNVGTDPYWTGRYDGNPYEYVYDSTKKCVDVANRFGKEHNIWIQTFQNRFGYEEDIVTAFHAAYDAGARNILTWSFMGGESNSYRAENPARTWLKTTEGIRRLRDIERDRLLEENRKKYMK